MVAYSNLWVGHWVTHWDLEIIEEDHLRHVLKGFFQNAIVRDWWQEHGPHWSTVNTPRRKRFIQILTEECQHAMDKLQP